MTAYYNEFDPYAAQWLRNLISAGLIAPGEVDERSIQDVRPDELTGFTQCHFFAGIGVWSYALRLAGWPNDRPVWTGSCPCQPFSAAGKGGGIADPRHLWPDWRWLQKHGKPRGVPVFGEQVASKDGLAWLDIVSTDVERAGDTIWPFDLCAAGIGSPNIRQRQFFVILADATGEQRARYGGTWSGREGYSNGCADGFMVNAIKPRLEGHAGHGQGGSEPRRLDQEEDRPVAETGVSCGLEYAPSNGRDERWTEPNGRGVTSGCCDGGMADMHGDRCDQGRQCIATTGNDGIVGNGTAGQMEYLERPGPVNGFWRDADWIFCTDGKWRPIEPGTFPLVDGASFKLGSGSAYEGKSRAGMLKGYGNAINAEVAIAFISAMMGAMDA